jgi:uncharacterized membrane protein
MAKHPYSEVEVAEWRKQHRVFIYFNMDDSNFMVPKSYGFGKTFNWANPVSWVITVVLIAFIVWRLIHG